MTIEKFEENYLLFSLFDGTLFELLGIGDVAC